MFDSNAMQTADLSSIMQFRQMPRVVNPAGDLTSQDRATVSETNGNASC